MKAFPAVVEVPIILLELIEKLPNKLIVPAAVRFPLILRVDATEGLMVKFPPTFMVVDPVDWDAIFNVEAAVEFIKKLFTVSVRAPDVAIVVVAVTELLILKSPVTDTVLLIPLVENTSLAEPSTKMLPPTLRKLFEDVSNSLKVAAPVPVASTVKFPATEVSAPARLINVDGPEEQFQVKFPNA